MQDLADRELRPTDRRPRGQGGIERGGPAVPTPARAQRRPSSGARSPLAIKRRRRYATGAVERGTLRTVDE
jgi:hypothetical protein